jgi:thioredoxin reductase
MGGTVAHYPRQKLVMSDTVNLPYYGPFGRAQMSKEDLIAAFHDLTARARIGVYEGTKLVGIDGHRDEFLVRTSRGSLSARRVVLAIGRRGSPRPLGVTGEALPKVVYRLIDPRQYDGKRVLVVGGGDSALEAAIMLAEESSAEVGIVYRRPEFARCRPPNKQKIDRLIASRRVRAFLSTEVGAVKPPVVELRVGGGAARAVPNDFVIACLGGELPTEFLKSINVGIRRHQGDRAMPNPALAARTPAENSHLGDRGWLSVLGLALLGCAIVAVLGAVGYRYYRLPQALRYLSPDHARLKPSGAWGHGVGILATLFMLSNFAYSVRKRWKRFKGKGSIAPWLRFHVFVGTMSPLTILFHSAFQWNNHLATATYVSLVVLVTTGLVGRYLYGLLRFDRDSAVEASALRQRLGQAMGGLPQLPRLARLVAGDQGTGGASEKGSPALGLLFGMAADHYHLRHELASARRLFVHRPTWTAFRAQALRLRRLDVRRRADRRFKRLMSQWRVVHVTLAILVIGLICLHISISVRFGFKWIWS